MKLLIAIIRAEYLNGVESALEGTGASLLTVTEAIYAPASHVGSYRGSEYRTRESRLRLEIVQPNDRRIEETIDEISLAATEPQQAGCAPGEVLVLDLDDALQFRRGAAGSTRASKHAPAR